MFQTLPNQISYRCGFDDKSKNTLQVNYHKDELWLKWTYRMQMHILFEKLKRVGDITKMVESPLYFCCDKRDGTYIDNRMREENWNRAFKGSKDVTTQGSLKENEMTTYQFPGQSNTPERYHKWDEENGREVGKYCTTRLRITCF